ncbi:Hypothetical predicted protein [Paramuricea clavata]|uniref:Uncharacterized protein n=1 Tax=Paramuricea clavata TaxID=317549 RepID=A0A7D9I2S7_PARCT|nr:Hypothetical predicted protein [Paramuricea clavata]
MGYGLGNLFRSLARVVTPLVKKGAKTLGKIVATTGADLLGDVAAGKNVKEAARVGGLEALGAAKTKALEHIWARKQPKEQSGRGRRSRGGKRSRSRSKNTKRSRNRKPSIKRSRSKKRAVKKRKPSRSTTRSRSAKKRKTSPQDIFG